MDADLDLLLIAVFCAADDLLPERAKNAKRMVTDAEVITLCVAQAIMGIPEDPRFLAVAAKRLSHLFPRLPKQPGFWRRRNRLADTIEALIAEFARHSPGFEDDLLLVDSTPVECARSIETTRRSQLADAADYGYCASHSRFFWGFRLHALFALDGTPRALSLNSPKAGEREVCLGLLARCQRTGTVVVIGDKGYAGRDFEADAAALEATIMRPRRKDEPGRGPHLAPHPPTNRVDLSNLQRPAHPRTPRRPHPARPARAHLRALARPHRRHRAQPPPRPPTPRSHRLPRLTTWNQSSRRRGDRRGCRRRAKGSASCGR